MIQHHGGAIEMARTEQKKGEDEDVVAPAGDIAKAQTAEIAQMRKLLAAGS